MDLRHLAFAVEKALMDEELLRLLHYAPAHSTDDPLDKNKPDILSLPLDEKWAIIRKHIMSGPDWEDLEYERISRIICYPGYGRSATQNYLYTNQEFYFDIVTHFAIENIDKRLEWICDRVNTLLFQQRVADLGKVLFVTRYPINTPRNYVGYRVVYEFIANNR